MDGVGMMGSMGSMSRWADLRMPAPANSVSTRRQSVCGLAPLRGADGGGRDPAVSPAVAGSTAGYRLLSLRDARSPLALDFAHLGHAGE